LHQPTRHRRRELRRPLATTLAGALVLAIAFPAAAEVMPLPRPRPAVGTPVASGEDLEAAKPRRTLFGLKKPPPPSGSSRFTPAEQELLFNISDYFNSFSTMEGQFIQFGPHGEQSEGVFYISRPGKIRFHYKPPVKLDVLADGKNVAVRDNRTMTQDLYPLSKTPLRYLLSAKIDLTSDKVVTDVREETDLISLIIVEKSKLIQGKLTMIFDKKTYELKQWIVTDAQGLNTAVAIFNTTTGKKADPALFKIVYFGMTDPNGN